MKIWCFGQIQFTAISLWEKCFLICTQHSSQMLIEMLKQEQQFWPLFPSEETAELNKNIMTQSELLLHNTDYMDLMAGTETTGGQG